MSLLKWALVFLILALLAALFGFGNLAEGFADVAKILFGVFLVIVLVLGILGLTVYKAVT
jgi:uncharacterized membrane protein YtjA (UPF0391 family)